MKSIKTAIFLIPALFILLNARSAFGDGGREVVCTPVYGMANSCAEHTVVDTGLDTSTFTGASAISYILGLAAFIKAKRG